MSRTQRVPTSVPKPELVRAFRHVAGDRGERSHPRFAPDAVAYLQRQDWADRDCRLHTFVAQVAATFPEHEIDEPLAAILLHGERRHVDRWRATDARPLPMPNRRRPPPIVAAEEVLDVMKLRNDLAQAIDDGLPSAALGLAAVANLLGLRRTTDAEQMRRRRITPPTEPDA